jgi:hypothetical protein
MNELKIALSGCGHDVANCSDPVLHVRDVLRQAQH